VAKTPIKVLHERAVYENDFVQVMDDDVEFPSGRKGRHLRIIESGGQPGAAVLARSGERYALVRVWRHALKAWEWGIPRGFAHGPDPEQTGRRELKQELGGEPCELTSLGDMTPNSGLLAGRVRLLFAHFDADVSTPIDTDEVAEVRWVDMSTLRAEIIDGGIVDGFTLAALAAAAIRGLIDL
jgi:ADP-ribose pyrophosphatase